MPKEVEFIGTNKKLFNLYDANGSLLSRTLDSAGVTLLKSNYLGEIQYENDSLKYVFTQEGFIDKDLKYNYLIKDHLENTRIVLNEKNEVIREKLLSIWQCY